MTNADIALMVTKLDSEPFYTAEVIIDGKVTHVRQFATRLAALRHTAFQTIEIANQKEENPND
jgi:predicted ATP-dependent serine protease